MAAAQQASRFASHSVQDYASARSIAMSAGDLTVVIRAEAERVLKSNRNNLLRSIDAGLKELAARELISSEEATKLSGACKHVVNAVRGKEDAEDAFLANRAIYHDLLADQMSSPAALAIASVASSAFNLEKNSPLKVTPMTTGAGAVTGAVIGGAIGGIVGGWLGAGLGAAIGGAAGAAVGFCNEHGI